MDISSEQSEHFKNLSKITNFFQRTSESGLLFCVCTNQALVRQVNEQIKARTDSLGLDIRELYISSDDMDNFIPIIRQAANEKPNGIIVNNLDELILVSKGSFLEGMNLAREILLDLDIPMLFWLSERNVSLFANKAQDLFRRRDRGVVYFSDLSGSSGMDRFKESYSQEYMSSEDYKNLNLKIELLEKQLGEAEAKQYKEKRIATEIVADLIELYLDAFLRDEAYALFEKYGKYFEDDENIKYVNLKAKLYYQICMWDKALEFFLKSERINLEIGNKSGLAATYNNIGVIYDNKGDWDRALEFHLKSEKINLEVGNKSWGGRTYNNIGVCYRHKGNWDKALEFFLKSEKINLDIGDKSGLAATYSNIGQLYHHKGDWDRALEFHLKSEKIKNELGDREGLGQTYNNIGAIYDNKSDWDKALEFFLKSEKINLDVGNKAQLGTIYNNIGEIYRNKGNWDKALEFFLKSEKINLDVGDKALIGTIYNNIGLIYYNKGDRDRALDFLLKAEKIGFEIGDKSGLAITYFNIGIAYLNMKNDRNAKNYLILAGYIAKTLGMKHEFSAWQWALKPVIKKMGKKKFMKAGKKLFGKLKLSTVWTGIYRI